MNQIKHTPGAIFAAEIITAGKYGDSTKYSTVYGRKTVEGIADIIDRATASTKWGKKHQKHPLACP